MIQKPQLTLYFDGACEPTNPFGNMGMGVWIQDHFKQKIFEESHYIAKGYSNSNNVAEYIALEIGLDWLICQGLQQRNILCLGDSNLVINQMNGDWKIKQGLYVQHALRIKEKVQQFPNITFQWISRYQNEHADDLSKIKMIENGCQFSIQPRYDAPKNKMPRRRIRPNSSIS